MVAPAGSVGIDEVLSHARTRISNLARYDTYVIVLCQEGYTSSLAADSLRQIGLLSASDIYSGFAAWQAAGLPTTV